MVKKLMVVLALLLIPASQVLAGSDGTLTAGVAVQGEIADRQEQDVYSYTGQAGESVIITATALAGSSVDLVMELHNPAGDEIAMNDDADSETINPRIETTLPDDGDYSIVIHSFASASTGAYEILLESGQTSSPPPSNAESVVRLDEPVSGELVVGAYDAWIFTPDTDMRIQVALFSINVDTYLEIYDAGGNLLASDDDSGGGYNAAITGLDVIGGESYEIRAQSFDGSQGGNYILTVSRGLPPLEPVAIQYGDSIDGELQSGREAQYTFEGTSGDVVFIRVEGTFDSYMSLYDPNNNLLATDDDTGEDLQPVLSNIILPMDGTYRIVVAGYSSFDQGTFTLTLSQSDEVVTTGSTTLAYGNTTNGFLSPQQAVELTFTGAAGDLISIDVDAEFDGVLEVYAPNGDLVAQDDDSGTGLNPRIQNLTLPDGGEYLISLYSFTSDAQGSYRVSLNLLTEPSIQTLSYGASREAELEPGGIVDFNFEGSSGDSISAAVQSDFDTFLQLYDADGNLLAEDDDSAGDLQPALTNVELPADGTYTLVVTGFSSSEAGTFTINLSAEGAAPGGNALAYGDTVTNSLAAEDSVVYTFTGAANDVVTISADADFDGFLEVLAPSGESIASDDDSGVGLNPLIEGLTLPENGEYQIVLSTFGGSEGGSFSLSLSGSGETPPIVENMIAYGDVVEAELSPEGFVEYQFTAQAGDSVTVSVDAEFDGFLTLYAADGSVIASDDDSGEGLNPLLENITLESGGTYTLSLGSFTGEERGAFTLSLIQGEATIIQEPTQIITFSEQITADMNEDLLRQYVFNANAGDTVSVAAAVTDWDANLDLFVEIYQPDGSLLAADDDSGWRLNPALAGVELPEDGTYTIEVRGFAGGSLSEFMLILQEGTVYISPTGGTAVPLENGTVDVNLAAGETTLYSFAAAAGQLLTVTTESGEVGVDLYSADGLTEQALVSGESFEIPTEGTYLLLAYAQTGGADRLQVNLREAAPPEPVIVDRGEAASNLPARGTLDENEIQIWKFTPLLTGEYTFVLRSEDTAKRYDPYLVLVDGNGNVIAEDDDSGGNFNALLQSMPLSGGDTVSVQVRSFSEQSGGSYLLVIIAESVEEPTVVAGGELILGEATASALDIPSQQAEFSLTISEAGSFNIALEGLKLPYIDIYDADGNLVGRGAAVIKNQTLAAGTYTLHVYDRLNTIGEFTLTVSESRDE